MNKNEFIKRLSDKLAGLPQTERQDIISDFEEHFSAGLDSGKTEEQICEELGTPESCAASYLGGTDRPNAVQPVRPAANQSQPQYANAQAVNQRRNQFLWRILFIALVVLAFAAYPTALGLMAAPLAVVIVSVFVLAFVPSGVMVLFMLSLCVALFTAGLLIFFLMTWLLKLSFKKAEI